MLPRIMVRLLPVFAAWLCVGDFENNPLPSQKTLESSRMLKATWKTLRNRIVGGIASLRGAFSRPQQTAVDQGQRPPLEDKQHYIPRFLFKGFASKYISRKQVCVCYFHIVCAEGQEKNTRHIGYEPDFYGALLDDLIKKREDVYAKVLDRVREKRKIQNSDRDLVVEFVFSLALRTKHAREKMVSLIESSRDSLHSHFRDANSWADDLRKKANPSVAQWDKLAEDLGEKGQVAVLTNLHQNTSSQPFDSLKLWQDLHWRVEEFPPGSFILGDAPVLQVNTDSSIVSVFFGEGHRSMIVLPISDTLLLIGSEEPEAKPPALYLLNCGSAELSLLFFVSSQNRAEHEGVYHGLVGRRAPRQGTESATQVKSI
jgi:Protein of unknown function (DUF4238)